MQPLQLDCEQNSRRKLQLQSERFLCGLRFYFLAQFVLSLLDRLSAVMWHGDTAALIHFTVLLGCVSYLKAPLVVFMHHTDLWVISSKLCINRSKWVLYYSPATVKYLPVPSPSAALLELELPPVIRYPHLDIGADPIF